MTPAGCLKVWLRDLTPGAQDAVKDIIEPRLLRRAFLGEPINASDHVRLCAHLGLDPMTGQARPAIQAGPLHWPSLSAALRMRRITDKLSLRKAAMAARTSHSALARIERGEQHVSIEVVMIVCRWLGRHPFDFVSPCVSRETSTETKAREAAPASL